MKIFIDPGHNYSGADTGAAGYGLKEQEVSYRIGAHLKGMLEGAGHSVRMSREALTDNVGVSVNESLRLRYKTANAWGADLFLSIHCNASENPAAAGTETLVFGLTGKGAEYAEGIQNAVVRRLETRNRGVKPRPDLAVLKGTAMPAVLVETAFITNKEDAQKLKDQQGSFAEAIYEGITGRASEETRPATGQTVMKLEQVFVQEFTPDAFRLEICDCPKRNVGKDKYFNAGFFTTEQGGKTIPVGNLAIRGEIISQAKDNASWINLSGRRLTTIYTKKDGSCGVTKTDDLSQINGLSMAISGIPIILDGKKVSLDAVKSEGYFGNEIYETWHGFLGIRHGKLCYVAARCGFEEMPWIMVALGIYDAIKLDGGGSFILHDGSGLAGTSENRRIHNIGVWY